MSRSILDQARAALEVQGPMLSFAEMQAAVSACTSAVECHSLMVKLGLIVETSTGKSDIVNSIVYDRERGVNLLPECPDEFADAESPTGRRNSYQLRPYQLRALEFMRSVRGRDLAAAFFERQSQPRLHRQGPKPELVFVSLEMDYSKIEKRVLDGLQKKAERLAMAETPAPEDYDPDPETPPEPPAHPKNRPFYRRHERW